MATQVKPVRPIAAYIGGKIRLAKAIVATINKIPHECYAEPFLGMGGVFLRRDQKPKYEKINDISNDIVNLFRVVQLHYTALLDEFQFGICSRAEFERLLAVPAEVLTDIQRAARFLYLQRLRFSGNVKSKVFGISSKQHSRFNITKLKPMIEELHTRLVNVTIERLPYADFIRRYDHKCGTTLFYIDPPYLGFEEHYGKGVFSRDDFAILADQLASIKGKFIMSINNAPEIRELYNNFEIREVDILYTGSAGKNKEVTELLISNN